MLLFLLRGARRGEKQSTAPQGIDRLSIYVTAPEACVHLRYSVGMPLFSYSQGTTTFTGTPPTHRSLETTLQKKSLYR